MSTSHKVLIWDVETSFMLASLFQARQDFVASKMFQHEVFMLTWAAKWEGSRDVMSGKLTGEEALAQDDTRIVADLIDLVREADVLVAHNGNGFDNKVLRGRAMLNQQEPLGPIRSIDTCAEAKNSFRLSHNSLDHLARHLGVPTKLHTSFELWRDCYYGDESALAKMDRYCRKDVRVLEQVYQLMKPHIRGLPRLQDPEYDDEHSCTHCGSDHLQWRGYYPTNAGRFRRFQCQDCRRWGRSRRAEKTRLSTVPLR